MDIKEIALRLLVEEFPGMRQENQAFMADFAEALIESYKAELLKEVGEPVAEFVLCISASGFGTEWRTGESAWWSAVEPERRAKVFTSDQVAAAVAKAEQRVAEACVLLCMDAVTKSKSSLFRSGAIIVAGEIRDGEWRKFLKEV